MNISRSIERERMKILSVFVLIMCMYGQVNAQKGGRSYHFSKGEVLDILLLNRNVESDSLRDVYFKTAIPIALNYGYKPNKGFNIVEAPLWGNYHPENLIVATWPNEELRATCLNKLESEVDSFHEMRRKIWTNFNVTYYPLSNDLDFVIDMANYNVATAFWKVERADINGLMENYERAVKQSGGLWVLKLTNGKTTFGYRYNPSVFFITSWKSKSDFERFKSIQDDLNLDVIDHVNQFHIE